MTAVGLVRDGAPDRDPFEVARAWLDKHGRIGFATVVTTWGSAPVPVGGSLVVAPDGSFEGSVSGGCVEAEVIHAAQDAIATGDPRLLSFGVEDETAWRAGLPCGGKIEVFVRAMSAADATFIEDVLTARRTRASLVVREALTGGARTVFREIPTDDATVAVAFRSGRSAVVDAADGRAFVNALAPAIRVVIVGATHIAQVLAELAPRVGYTATVIDPRSAFASPDRFGAVDRVLEWPQDSFLAGDLDARTAVVTLSHVPHIDDEALKAALRSDCFYVGALGSKRSHEKRVERLTAAGLSDEQIARIRAPVGLAIGAKGPAEIAVSILAEIVRDSRAP